MKNEITERKNTSAFDQTNEINRIAQRVKEKQKVAEATEDKACDPTTVAHSKNAYERSIESMNRPVKNDEEQSVKGHENNKKQARDDDRTKPN